MALLTKEHYLLRMYLIETKKQDDETALDIYLRDVERLGEAAWESEPVKDDLRDQYLLVGAHFKDSYPKLSAEIVGRYGR